MTDTDRPAGFSAGGARTSGGAEGDDAHGAAARAGDRAPDDAPDEGRRRARLAEGSGVIGTADQAMLAESREVARSAGAPAVAAAWLLFALGIGVGVVLDVIVVFWWSLVRGARAVHAEGLLCRAEVEAVAHGPGAHIGAQLAGPAMVRLSGAFRQEDATGADILGLALRTRATGGDWTDASDGDQDLILGTFESFASARRDWERTRVDDYLANEYSSVTRWRVPGIGIVRLRVLPPPPRDPDRAGERRDRLARDIGDGAAVLRLEARSGSGRRVGIARIRLLELLPLDGRALRTSVFRTGRGLRPTGFRNGIRAAVYPASQLARRLRDG